MPDFLLVNIIFFSVGLIVILKGSDLFLGSAIWIAKTSGVSQIIIGATIVSLCTTMPELISSVTAALRGASDMALGNAVGSIICNTGLILGLLLVLLPVTIRREIYMIKGVFMLGALIMAIMMLIPGIDQPDLMQISRAEGGIMLTVLIIYLVVNYYESLHAGPDTEIIVGIDAPPQLAAAVSHRDWLHQILLFAGGMLMVGVGAWILVEFGQKIARNLGASEAVVSLLLLAFGTSLPELFTAISAVRKKAEQISIGNIFGANVLNLTLVSGVSALVRPLQLEDAFLARVDLPVAMLICTCIYAVGLISGRLGRNSGILLLLLYTSYIISMFSMGRIAI